jgi:hypothetical protein
MSTELVVRSHVARDLLQTSALFKTDKAVVWEYVSNGLDYSEEATPTVYVRIDADEKSITISDNGRGMDRVGLQNFFTMHGENLDRREGRTKRGMFGTGKAAAFGIADVLRITTIKDRVRNVVELSRSDIKQMKSDSPVPIRTIENNSETEERNGTSIEIRGIRLKKIDAAGVIAHIQQQLALMPSHVRVFVNSRECEYQEPVAVSVRSFIPEGGALQRLGGATLTIKVAGTPLEENQRGVGIYSHGVMHERTLAGLDGKDMSQYLFGSIDIPALDAEADSDIPAFDMSRSQKLNLENELVRIIYSFVGQKLDLVRRELVEAQREKRLSDEAKRLAKEASIIARVINEDFSDFRLKVTKIAARGRGGVDRQTLSHETGVDDALRGGEHLASEEPFVAAGSEGQRKTEGTEPRLLSKPLKLDDAGAEPATPAAPKKEGTRSGGGFGVQFRNMGVEEARAKYVRDERVIYVNLDHPQLVAAKPREGGEDALFRQLSYEIAFSEYSIALASELSREGEYIDSSDPIVDIRNTINRLSRRAANLFSRI